MRRDPTNVEAPSWMTPITQAPNIPRPQVSRSVRAHPVTFKTLRTSLAGALVTFAVTWSFSLELLQALVNGLLRRDWRFKK
jgi:hypothetical protein